MNFVARLILTFATRVMGEGLATKTVWGYCELLAWGWCGWRKLGVYATVGK